jgi:hypothetical protein
MLISKSMFSLLLQNLEQLLLIHEVQGFPSAEQKEYYVVPGRIGLSVNNADGVRSLNVVVFFFFNYLIISPQSPRD